MDLISRQDVFDMIDAVFREECEKRNTTYEEADEMTQWYLCGMMKVMEKVFDIPSAHCDNCPYPDEYVNAKEDDCERRCEKWEDSKTSQE